MVRRSEIISKVVILSGRIEMEDGSVKDIRAYRESITNTINDIFT